MIEQDIDSLLYAGEGVAVDYKANQYVMSRSKAGDCPEGVDLGEHYKLKKSELLKTSLRWQMLGGMWMRTS